MAAALLLFSIACFSLGLCYINQMKKLPAKPRINIVISFMQRNIKNPHIAVSFTPNNSKLREKAVTLAEKLHLPCVENPEANEDILFLFYGEDGLSLCQFYGRQHCLKKVLFVDFIYGKNGFLDESSGFCYTGFFQILYGRGLWTQTRLWYWGAA